MEEIVQVVKIADTTLKKRLDEFKATPSGNLTLADFRNVWLEEEMDPPAYTKGKEKEEAERKARERAENGEEDECAVPDAQRSRGCNWCYAHGRSESTSAHLDLNSEWLARRVRPCRWCSSARCCRGDESVEYCGGCGKGE